MNKESLLTLVNDPSRTTPEEKQALSEMVNSFPYFHTVHLIHLFNRKKFDDPQFEDALRKSALMVPDRKVLYNLLQKSTEKVQKTQDQEVKVQVQEMKVPEVVKEEPSTDFLLEIDENLPEENSEKAKVIEFDLSPSTTEMNSNNFELEEETAREEISDNAPNFDLIQKFIEENPVFTPNKLTLNDQREDISINSIQEDQELATETMAAIFTGQKLYDKAIAIYEKLILKFPEKSAYFADRINELKNKL